MPEAPPTSDRATHPFYTYDMIFEIPQAIKQTLQAMEGKVQPIARKLEDRSRIYFTGCGTAFFASMLGSQVLTPSREVSVRFASVPALELQSYGYPIDDTCAVVGISHSGITKTTVDALKHAREKGALTIGVTHFASRPISGASDETLVVGNGPDISRCHTKCYVASAVACMRIGIELLKHFEGREPDRLNRLESGLNQLPEIAARVLKSVDGLCKRLAEGRRSSDSCYFAGTGPNVPNTLEAALKIMETSFIPAQGFETEQLLHGPWVSMDDRSTLVVLAPNGMCHERNVALVKAAKEFGTPVIGLIDDEDSELRSLCDEAVQLPAVDEYLSPFTNIIPLYLFAYYSSVARGFNPDLLRYSTPAYWRGRQVIFPPGTH
ncbi:MAG: SIS domain-containing protein [Candidatus Bathyarchaeia archaeon]